MTASLCSFHKPVNPETQCVTKEQNYGIAKPTSFNLAKFKTQLGVRSMLACHKHYRTSVYMPCAQHIVHQRNQENADEHDRRPVETLTVVTSQHCKFTISRHVVDLRSDRRRDRPESEE